MGRASTNLECYVCANPGLCFRFNLGTGKAIYICDNCRNAITVPGPEVAYEQNRFYVQSEKAEALYRSFATPIVEFIKRHLAGGRLLDVGTGGGLLIEEAAKFGFEAEGIDPSIGAVEFCTQRGLKVKCGSLEQDSYPAHSFDVVVLAHVIEHSPDPSQLLRTARRLLKPGGLICLSQTNYMGTVPRLLGTNWRFWVPQEHFVHFTPQGIQFLLEKTGLAMVELKSLPLGYFLHWTIGGPEAIVNNVGDLVGFFISKLRLGFPFVGDQMYILASSPTEKDS